VAGLLIAGYIIVEAVMLGQGFSWIEGLYFGLGLLISGLATSLWMVERRAHSLHIKQT